MDSVNKNKVGILVVNLGTPDEPGTSAVRRYLAEFLWDPRVVEFPRLLWWLVLHGFILRVRPAKVARAYQSIWTSEGSPLRTISEQQANGLAEALSNSESAIVVELAMRYGKPSIESALERLRDKGVDTLYVLPMYPQYSATTTAAVYDEIFRVFGKWRELPTLHCIQAYYDHPFYIRALADSVREHWQNHQRAEKLLFSFHGIPKRYIVAGDPYQAQCQETARLLAIELQLADDEWKLVYQSRFGKEEWLNPYADITLCEMAKQGMKSVDVLCPGFSADCLETLEEISEQNQELFFKNGGETFTYIPALNDRDDHIACLRKVLVDHGLKTG